MVRARCPQTVKTACAGFIAFNYRGQLMDNAPFRREPVRKVVEWMPGHWWVLVQTGKDGSHTPLYEGQGSTASERKQDAEKWLQEHPSVYQQLVTAGCEIANHESDLYVVATKAAATILAGYEFRENVRQFKGTDGRLWFDVPFAYEPFWVTNAGRP
jgi:hypothetical protein